MKTGQTLGLENNLLYSQSCSQQSPHFRKCNLLLTPGRGIFVAPGQVSFPSVKLRSVIIQTPTIDRRFALSRATSIILHETVVEKALRHVELFLIFVDTNLWSIHSPHVLICLISIPLSLIIMMIVFLFGA